MADDIGIIVTRQTKIARDVMRGGVGMIETDRTIVDLADRLDVMTRRALEAEENARRWESECKLYVSSWRSALDNKIIHKRHLIDALALTTQQLKEKAYKWDERERVLNSPETIALAAEQECADKRAEWMNRAMRQAAVKLWVELGLDSRHSTLDEAIDAKLNEE